MEQKFQEFIDNATTEEVEQLIELMEVSEDRNLKELVLGLSRVLV
jgi:hypothetical protein